MISHFDFRDKTFLFGKAEIFSIFMIKNFLKPHTNSGIYLDEQKKFVPKKLSHVSN